MKRITRRLTEAEAAAYAEGRHRLGCIGCPMAGTATRVAEFMRWSQYKKLYLLAIEHMMAESERRGKAKWRCDGVDRHDITAEEVFDWWMERAQIERKDEPTAGDVVPRNDT